MLKHFSETDEGVLLYENSPVLFWFTEEMIMQDDYVSIHTPNCENCQIRSFQKIRGEKQCESDISNIYLKIYKNLSESEKDGVDSWIYGNLLYVSSDEVKKAIDDNSDVKKHLKELQIDRPKCMRRP